jgi:DNA-binding XRE family transcriptional regulator
MTAGTTSYAASFGALLQQHRTVAGLSQEELAERAGLSRRGISDLERGCAAYALFRYGAPTCRSPRPWHD